MRREDIYTIHIRYPKKSMGFNISQLTKAFEDYLKTYNRRPKKYKCGSNRDLTISRKILVD